MKIVLEYPDILHKGNDMNFSDQILSFYNHLNITSTLPEGVEILKPYKDQQAVTLCEQFFQKYYADNTKRFLILGINPGRHGGGITGIPFTDPLKLEQYCGIQNTFAKKTELSADFIYTMINAYGGPEKFYNQFYISAVSPLGFTKDGKNLNYYDIKELQDGLKDFIVQCLMKQLEFGIDRTACFCLGEGENYKYVNRLNNELKIFETIVPLPHPRFIMQYRRKEVQYFVDLYIEKLRGNTNLQ